MGDQNNQGTGEFDLIARYFRPLTDGFADALNLEDDAAALVVPDGQSLVTTADALVEGVHFLGTEDAADIAWKALAVNLSDLAGMGALPYAYTLTLALPKQAKDAWVARFAHGLEQAQAEFCVSLAGGDTVATPGPLTLSVTAMGFCPPAQLLTRSGASIGDDVWVGGTIGDGTHGLKAARTGFPELASDLNDALARAYLRPTPQLSLGQALRGIATAAMDISDGLVADLAHLVTASGVSATVEFAEVPLSPAVSALGVMDQAHGLQAITGGDDYRLLFTAAAIERDHLQQLARELNLPSMTRIGQIHDKSEAPRVRVLDQNGIPLRLDKTGYQHR